MKDKDEELIKKLAQNRAKEKNKKLRELAKQELIEKYSFSDKEAELMLDKVEHLAFKLVDKKMETLKKKSNASFYI